MFQLLIIGSVSTSTGSIWKKKPTDLYIIEITEPTVENDRKIVSVNSCCSYFALASNT